ncbi:MAG: outer membrane protein transport protein [Bacteroidetes bacterium]|nr:outer membrane protein transport protein [Bacteroidota bacterium]
MRRITFLLLLFCFAALTSMGGGYQVGLHSTRNTGMGLIGTSLTYDASSIFYNPGGVSFIKDKWSLSGGVSLIMARVTFQGKDENYQTHLEHQLNTPFYVYASYKATDNLSIGLAVNTPYGNGLSWGDNWQGRFLIQNLKFQAITVQPTISYKFKNIIGVGVGLVWAYGSVNLNKALPLDYTGGEGQLNIKGNTIGFGFNAGVLIHPVKGFNIGIDYRSKINMDVQNANATFTVPAAVRPQFPDSKVEVSLPLPANLDFGLSYEINEKFMIGINLCYVFWKQYDSLVFNFKTKTASLGRTATAALYQNRLIPRIGFQYKVNPTVTVRLGGYYDPSPVPSDYLNPQTPSTNEIGLTAGLSVFPFKGFSIDAAFLYLMGMKRDGTYSPENFAGTYYSAFYIPAIGLSYSF